MNVDSFARQIVAMQNRLTLLLDQGSASTLVPNPAAFKELGVASEELQVAVEELRQQNDALAAALLAAETERQRYQNLFEFLPEACLVTNLDGMIQEANRAAAKLLNVPARFLLGKPLSIFVSDSHCQFFRTLLNWYRHGKFNSELAQGSAQEWDLFLEPRDRPGLEVSCLTNLVTTPTDEAVALRWNIRELPVHKRLAKIEPQAELPKSKDGVIAILQGRPLEFFDRGDIISLNPNALWLVVQGLVKLTTQTEKSEEVLIGMVGPNMPFGPYFTALQIYQATALSNVRLMSVPLSEIFASPQLSQHFLAKASQRLRQTEALLAIAGQRRVESRLYQLLSLLKEEIGQPTSDGMRLDVRLTHEDLANACCTTRVTVTRLMGKLQQEGKVKLDKKYHITLS